MCGPQTQTWRLLEDAAQTRPPGCRQLPPPRHRWLLSLPALPPFPSQTAILISSIHARCCCLIVIVWGLAPAADYVCIWLRHTHLQESSSSQHLPSHLHHTQLHTHTHTHSPRMSVHSNLLCVAVEISFKLPGSRLDKRARRSPGSSTENEILGLIWRAVVSGDDSLSQ